MATLGQSCQEEIGSNDGGRCPRRSRLIITKQKTPNPFPVDLGAKTNGSRVRLWKLELQRLADELAIPIRVSHFPPGTSKWNKIEHRLFSHISLNWRGRPLISYEVIVNLIAATTTRKGLKVQVQLDTRSYPKGIKVPDEDFAAIRLTRDSFHGEWNYVIAPNGT